MVGELVGGTGWLEGRMVETTTHPPISLLPFVLSNRIPQFEAGHMATSSNDSVTSFPGIAIWRSPISQVINRRVCATSRKRS